MKSLIKEVVTLIVHFSPIPEDKWCVGTRDNGQGQRCAHGHCYKSNESMKEANQMEKFLWRLSRKHLGYFGIALINNFQSNLYIKGDYFNHGYNQDTPKQRVLAFLNDCLKKELEEINAKLKTNEKIVYVTVDQVVKDLTKLELVSN